jgi:hypothetical protein
MFQSVIGKWSPDTGLFEIIANSETYNNDPYGISIQADYDKIKEQIDSVYGESFEIQQIRPGALYSEDREFLESMLRSERLHGAMWSEDTGARLPKDLSQISLAIVAESEDAGYISLTYYSSEAPSFNADLPTDML